MIAKKIIGLTLLASAGIYVAVQKFGKSKPPSISATPVDVSKTALPTSSNGGIVWNGAIDNLPGVILVSTSGVPLNGLILLN